MARLARTPAASKQAARAARGRVLAAPDLSRSRKTTGAGVAKGAAFAKRARESARLAFGRDGLPWGEEYVLERYELLYEAGLVSEAFTDGRENAAPKSAVPGEALQLDHRRILATAVGRLRAKLKYRPVIFDLMPQTFTLTQLQHTAEMVLGVTLHKQNFRRLVEKSGFLEATGRMSKARGRPAELFKFRHQERSERPLAGLRVSAGRTRASDV